MGPNDPFETIERTLERRAHHADGSRLAYPEPTTPTGMPHESLIKRYLPLLGLALGMLFGILMLTYSFAGALLVYACGGLGAFVGWLGYGIAAGRLDVAGAWRALRGADRNRLR